MEGKTAMIVQASKEKANSPASKPSLFLLSAAAPFGKNEAYLRSELKVLTHHFERIFVIPFKQPQGQAWELPENASAVDLTDYPVPPRKELLKRYGAVIGKIIRLEFSERKYWSKKLSNVVDKIKVLLNIARKAEKLKAWAKENNIDLQEICLYSNWFAEGWTEALGMLKMKEEIQSFVCRVHGYDLYPDRHPYNYIFFRPFHLKYVDQVVCISQAGQEFLSDQYPHHENKICLSYMGVFDHGFTQKQPTEEISILSCSHVIPLKRVDRILSIAQKLNRPVRWTHFGAGTLDKELHALAQSLPAQVKWEFPGMVKHEVVMDYFKNKHVDFFINVSTTEGLPVSIMEAISFGVPCVATDVGGTKEIVKDKTGLLIPSDFDDETVAQQILDRIDRFRSPEYRQGVRQFWEEHFDAEKNFMSFIDIIKQSRNKVS